MTNLKSVFIALALGFSAAVQAAYPEKPVTIVIPFAPGGPADKSVQALIEAMREPLGQPLQVEYAPGGGGTLGTKKVSKAAADGYTVLFSHIGMAASPGLYRTMPYDPLNDFEFLGLMVEVPMVIVGRPTLPANDFTELAQWIRADKDKVTFAHSGLGSASHLCGLLLQSALQVSMNTVPYKGTGPAMTDLVTGTVDLMCDQTMTTAANMEGAKIKGYAVTTPLRLTVAPFKSLATLHESGLKGFNLTVWQGLYAPKGTPAVAVAKLNSALRAALKNPAFIKSQTALGIQVVSDNRNTSAGHKKFVEGEIAKWTPVIKAAGQYAD